MHSTHYQEIKQDQHFLNIPIAKCFEGTGQLKILKAQPLQLNSEHMGNYDTKTKIIIIIKEVMIQIKLKKEWMMSS